MPPLRQSSSNEPIGNLPPCPSRGSDVTNQIDCVCMPPFGKGSRIGVEGSGPYSWYSNICLSAIHAGAIDREGGEVRIIPRPPQASFKGTLANGVYSTDFGSSAKASFDVEKLLSE